MAKVSVDIIKLLKKYIEALGKNNFPINKAFLFGSYARGINDLWSDIDVALVSDNFEGNRFLDKDKIRKITLSIDYNISPMPYKTEDFDESDLFVQEIIKTGIRIL